MTGRVVVVKSPNAVIELVMYYGVESNRAMLTTAQAIQLAENLLSAATSRLAEYHRAAPERVAGMFEP